MRNILIVIKKQLKDTPKNITILIQFILFPILTLIMENAINMEDMPELFFTKLFSMMYIGMAPLTSTAAIISEEKEKNTLRVLMMANVKPWQYLMGVGICVWGICMTGAGIIATGLNGKDVPFYLCFMGLGFIISIVAGACIGIYAKNQMVCTSIVMPIMMVLSFSPMLAMFNPNIAKFSRIFYTHQLKDSLDKMSFSCVSGKNMGIIVANALLFLVLFYLIYKRKGLE